MVWSCLVFPEPGGFDSCSMFARLYLTGFDLTPTYKCAAQTLSATCNSHRDMLILFRTQASTMPWGRGCNCQERAEQVLCEATLNRAVGLEWASE